MRPNQFGSPWTDELRAEVKELWKSQTASQIAASLNSRGCSFTRSAIIGCMHRMGLTRQDAVTRNLTRKKKPPAGPRKFKTAIRLVGNSSAGAGGLVHIFVPEEIHLRCVEVEPRNLSLVDLEAGDCRYGYGNGPFTFCGHPVKAGSSYCTPHHFLCWDRPRVAIHKFAGVAA